MANLMQNSFWLSFYKSYTRFVEESYDFTTLIVLADLFNDMM